MSVLTEKQIDDCPREALAAYIDCELTEEEERLVESHLSGCGTCLEEFNLQKRMLAAITPVLSGSTAFPDVPENFARIVSVRAENNLEQIRKGGERSAAGLIVALLLLFTAAGLSLAGGRDAFVAVEKLGAQAFTVTGFVTHSLFELGTGIGVVLKYAGSLVFGSNGASILSVGSFLAASVALSRMLRKDLRS